jgi:hypothetical protein
MGVISVHEINIDNLKPGVLAVTTSYWRDNEFGQTDINSMVTFDLKQLYNRPVMQQDRDLVASGKIPYIIAYGHSTTDEEVLAYTATHEAAHAKMSEHVLRQNQSQWLDAKNPSRGDKAWMSTLETAANAGWQPPSQYAMENTAEMFAECTTLMQSQGTTNNDGIDNYVNAVMGE